MKIPAFLHHEARSRPVLCAMLVCGGLVVGAMIGLALVQVLRVFFPAYHY